MKRKRFVLLAVVLSLSVSEAAMEASQKPADDSVIVVKDAWIPEMPPSSRVTAAYMVIENKSPNEVSLVAVKSDVAVTVEIHRMAMEDNMMRMKKMDRLRLPVGKTDLTGDYHIMLIDLKSPVRAGDEIKLTLEFENAPSKTLLVPVKKRKEV